MLSSLKFCTMSAKTLAVLLLLTAGIAGPSSGAKILSISFMSSVSHKIIYEQLYQKLAERGHELMVVSPIPSKSKLLPNHKEIQTLDLEKVYKEMDFGANIFEMRAEGPSLLMGFVPPPLRLGKAFEAICRKSYALPAVQKVMEEKFDLILLSPVFNECLYGLVHKMNTTTILLTQIATFPWIASNMGSPSLPSFVPSPFFGFSDEMSFFERTVNFLSAVETWAINRFYYEPKMEAVYREAFNDPSIPSIPEIAKEAAIILENQDPSFTRPRPKMADIISVGGMHMKPPKALPKELAEYVEGAGADGFILFSMGSALRGSLMPERMRKMFLNVFSKLKQRVLWKWETEDMADLPPNVKLSKWLPQQDVLGHKGIRAFITHGGHGSTQEALYNGVPLIGIPMFGDQTNNMKQAAKLGFAISLEFSELNEQVLGDAINEILNNDKYARSAKERSEVFHERPEHPLDTALFWTEYVIKHKGAPHLRSAARDLTIIQYYSLDVMSVIAAILFLFSVATCLILSKIIKFCKGSASSSKGLKTKRE